MQTNLPSIFNTIPFSSFYFTEQTKISSTTGGENSVVQMLGSLYTCIENDYGVMSSRLYRAFRPKPGIFL
jgi:ankyrin repeat-rich membrane spanning protein